MNAWRPPSQRRAWSVLSFAPLLPSRQLLRRGVLRRFQSLCSRYEFEMLLGVIENKMWDFGPQVQIPLQRPPPPPWSSRKALSDPLNANRPGHRQWPTQYGPLGALATTPTECSWRCSWRGPSGASTDSSPRRWPTSSGAWQGWHRHLPAAECLGSLIGGTMPTASSWSFSMPWGSRCGGSARSPKRRLPVEAARCLTCGDANAIAGHVLLV